MSQHSSSSYLGMLNYIGYTIYINTPYFERIHTIHSILKEYTDELEREAQGVTDRIKDLEDN